ncbi:MAG: hypothetical protein IMZ75_00840 [Actinobacteria bacterium]|nr:hypothetical protein [Actinomycetota bacterium]
MTLAKMMVDSCWWPLYEVINGEYKLSYDPKKRKVPVRDWMKLQGRFKHLFTPENEHILEEAQAQSDLDWEDLLKMCSLSAPSDEAAEA